MHQALPPASWTLPDTFVRPAAALPSAIDSLMPFFHDDSFPRASPVSTDSARSWSPMGAPQLVSQLCRLPHAAPLTDPPSS